MSCTVADAEDSSRHWQHKTKFSLTARGKKIGRGLPQLTPEEEMEDEVKLFVGGCCPLNAEEEQQTLLEIRSPL
jgi:hypothetical protein